MRNRTRKTILRASLGLVLLAVLAGCAGRERPGPAEKQPYKIGAILPLTGKLAWLGENTQKGLMIGEAQANTATIAGRPIQILYGDSKGEPKEAVALANKFIDVDKVDCLMVLGTAMVKAVLPIADRKQVLMFAFSIHPGITKTSPNLYRVYVSDDQEWRLLAEYIEQARLRRLGILRINAEYGLDSEAALKRHLGSAANIVFSEAYEIGQSDFRPILTKVKGKPVDAYVLMGYGSEYVPLLRQMKELGIRTKVLGNVDFVFDFVRKEQTAEGAIFTAPVFSFGEYTARAQAFVDEYRAKHGKIPEWDEAYSADAVGILAEALGRAKGTDAASVGAEIRKVRNYQGVSGVISMTADGDCDSAIRLATLRGGKVVEVKP